MFRYLNNIILLINLILASASIKSQCFDKNSSYLSGELVSYKISYNWKFIWIDAANVYFKVDSLSLNNKPVYHFFSYGQTNKTADVFFKVRDTYESYLEIETLKPLKFERKVQEGSFTAHDQVNFDYPKKKFTYQTHTSGAPLKKDTIDLPPCAYDVLSLIYCCRNINFNNYKKFDKIPLTIILTDKAYNIYIRYLGIETIETHDEKRYNCIKFKPLLVAGTIFNGGEDMTVWVTNDKNKIPVLVEAGILVGSIKVTLSSAKGLRHPFTAIVK